MLALDRRVELHGVLQNYPEKQLESDDEEFLPNSNRNYGNRVLGP